MANSHPAETPRQSTGIAGLDVVLRGGLPTNRLCVIEGDPGAGKTTLALQFLLEGVRAGQRGLYITLSETTDELADIAASHGWSLDGVELAELSSLAEHIQEEDNYTVYHPSDVELGDTVKRVRREIERVKPARVALDSVSELKILSQSHARYRREILGLKQFLSGKECTVVMLDDRTSQDGEQQLQSIAHGVIRMERQAREYGDTRRQLHVVKMRGVRFHDGFHDFCIQTGGIEVYPRLSMPGSSDTAEPGQVSSGNQKLDTLLGGGLDRGSSTLVLGPAGSGKTSLCSQYMMAALERGEAVACFLFEESRATFLARANGFGMRFESHLSSGLLQLLQVTPAEVAPGEFAHRIGRLVERGHTRFVVIDSLNGYINAMPNERFLPIHMHELLAFLGQHGVVTLLAMAQHGMLGAMRAPVDVSFLADTVVLLRFFEALGEVRKAISVVKKRRSGHERTIREMQLGPGGVQIGEALREIEGVLTGVPRYRGADSSLLNRKDER